MVKTLNIWGNGQILAFSGIDGATDYNDGIVMRTAFGEAGFNIRTPENGGRIRFDKAAIVPERLTLAGDFFECGDLKVAFLDTYHILFEGEFLLQPGRATEVVVNKNRILIGVQEYFNPELIDADIDEVIAKRRAYLEEISLPDGLSGVTVKTLTKAFSQMKTMVYAPEGEIKHRWTTPDRWPHRHMWLWDSVFHAIGFRHLNPSMAREALLAVFDLQAEDGFIPAYGAPGLRAPNTQGPVLAFGVKQVYDAEPSLNFLAKAYPHLKRYLEWDFANRDNDGAGLLEWYVEERKDCRSGESGMDNSPRFDSAMHLDAPDFNSLISMECEIMAGFASELGLKRDRQEWMERHEKLNRLINNRLWNDDEGFYFDYDVSTGRLSTVMASSGFLPLICGAASADQAKQLASHLNNPQTFKTPMPVSSIAVCDKKSYSKDMWRGPAWVNINWLIAHGFRRYGMHEQADMIINKTIAKIEEMYLKHGTFFEFYDDKNEVEPPQLLRKTKNIPDSFHQSFHDYGWTATLYVDMIYSRKSKTHEASVEKSYSCT
mgnify:CR=1 FL=1